MTTGCDHEAVDGWLTWGLLWPAVGLAGKEPALNCRRWRRCATARPEEVIDRFECAEGLGWAPPPGYLVLDVDPRNGGRSTLAEHEDRLGRLPATRVHTSGGDDGGMHLAYRVPIG